ncbi:MAG: hypothetical protein WD249_05535 [Gaiellaceae bacterium]
MSALEFLSPDLAAPEAVRRSPLERFLPEGTEDLSHLPKFKVRGEWGLVLEDPPPGAIDVSAAYAGLLITDERAMRRLTDLDLDKLPAAGAFARIEAIVFPGYRVFFPQEYGRYVCEAVEDALS